MLLSVVLILGQIAYGAQPSDSIEYLPSVRAALSLQINARRGESLKRQLVAKMEAVKGAEAEIKRLVAQGVNRPTADWYLWQLSYMAVDLADRMTRSPVPRGLTLDQEKYYRKGIQKQFVDPWLSGAAKGFARISSDFRLPRGKQGDYERALRVMGKESRLFGDSPTPSIWGNPQGEMTGGSRKGAANAPLNIHQISPVSGPVGGGTHVRLVGTGFSPETVVIVGGKPGLDVVRPNEGTLTFRTPPGEPGAVFIAVKNGSNGARIDGAFTYQAVAAAEPMAEGDESGIRVERVDGPQGGQPRAGGVFASCQAGAIDLWTGLFLALLCLCRRRPQGRPMG